MKIQEEFVLRKIAGENVLVPVGKTAAKLSGMISMSETAAFIWENLEKCENDEDMIKLVLDEFEVEPAQAAKDVTEFLTGLKTFGFIA